MNCQDFQNEFEERAGLSDAATLHFKECADCGKLYRQQSQIWQMIESLPEVAAPADFNHKFRARLATAKATDFRPAWWKSLSYVVPVFAAVLVLTIVFASQNFFVSTPPTQELAVITKDEKPPVVINNDAKAVTIDANVVPANYNASSNKVNLTLKIGQTSAPKVAAEDRDINKKETAPKKDDDFIGVKDFGINTASPPTLPNGFPQIGNKTATNPNEMTNSNGKNVEALSFLGVETTSENGKLRVISVKSGSPSARSGLRIGDIIETIEGKSISDSDPITTIRTMTVLRGNITIPITLRAQ